MKNTRLIFLCLFLSVIHSAYGQVIPFDNYFVQDGLPQNYVVDIEQEENGYLWLATQAGAVKFDGYNFITYSSSDGLPANYISDIFIDSKQRIWFATETGGLAVFQNNHFRVINESHGLVSNNSKKVFEDRKGNIWFTSREGFSIISPDTILSFDKHNSEDLGEIHASYVALDSSVWLSTYDKVFRYDNKLEVFNNDALFDIVVRSIAEDRKGSYWFGTQGNGVVHISDSGHKIFNSDNGLGSDYVFAIEPLAEGEILIGTSYPGVLLRIKNDQIVDNLTNDLEDFVIWDILKDSRERIWARTHLNGILLIDKGQLRNITKLNKLCDNQPSKIFEDRNGNIWISTLNGLSKYGKIIFEIYNQNLVNDEIIVQSIATYNNEIFIGTDEGLNILESGQKYKHINPAEGLSDHYPNVLSILPVNEDEIWLGTYNGLTRIKNNTVKFFPDSVFFSKDDFETCALDLAYTEESIFCASQLGLVQYKNGKYTLFTKADGLADDFVWSVETDVFGNIWCATVNGLSIFDGKVFHNFDSTAGLPDNYCNDIAFDSKGNGYVATENGLSKVILNKDWTISCDNFNLDDGLGSLVLLLVLVDKNDIVWVGHNLGVDRIDIDSRELKNYSTLEGFLPMETSLGAATLSQGKDIWFGTVNGAVRYIPDNDILDQNPPQVQITSIELIGDSTSLDSYADSIDQGTMLPIGLKLKYNKNTLNFNFVGIHYTIIEKNQYRYILEGYDNWSDPSTETEALYRRIPPGKYKFKVLASNCDGVWSPEPAVFAFEIRPPFWQTWWFYTLEALLAIGIIIVIVRYRERRLRHDREVLAQKVKERTIEIAKQRDQISIQKQEITDSIIYAERIQSAVLPNTDYIDKWLHDYFILFKPRDIVSGDYYWINGNKDRVMLVAADCTGHGVPGAFMSMLGVSILNEIATESRDIPAGEVLDMLRDHLTSTLWQTGGEKDAKDGMDMVLGILDYNKNMIQFAAAYNPLVLIRNEEIIVHKGDRMPVGYHPEKMPPFTTQQIQLKKGDLIYMYSDGYADQFGGPDGKKFKSVTFRNLLLEISQLSMNDQKERLNETIMNWMGINEQVDDILVIGIRI